MSSPDPMVSEAIIAPGPKMVSHDAGFLDVNASNGVRQVLTVLFSTKRTSCLSAH